MKRERNELLSAHKSVAWLYPALGALKEMDIRSAQPGAKVHFKG